MLPIKPIEIVRNRNASVNYATCSQPPVANETEGFFLKPCVTVQTIQKPIQNTNASPKHIKIPTTTDDTRPKVCESFLYAVNKTRKMT